MAVKRKARLDWLNFAYGIGAAVVITGAMFKFLELDHANEMLMIGLATEAVVFIISAFEMKKDDITYRWDRLFPQLTKEGESKIEKVEELLERSNLDPMVIERLVKSIEQLEQNVGKMNAVSDVAALNEHIGRMKQTSENFEREVTKLNTSIAEMNSYYNKMLEAMGSKR